MEETTGEKGEDIIPILNEVVWPLALLSSQLAAGKKFVGLEEAKELFGKDLFCDGGRMSTTEAVETLLRRSLASYFSDEINLLLAKWLRTRPRPFLAPGRRFGWLCECETVAHAAVAEMVLGYIHGWKVGFRFCEKCKRYYHGEECETCLPQKRERERLLGLLRVHKHRLRQEARRKREGVDKLPREARQKREEAADCLEAAAREIEKLQDKLRKGAPVRRIVDDYLEACKRYGLPTGWAKNY